MSLIDRVCLTLWLFAAGMMALTDHPKIAGFCLIGAAFSTIPDEIFRRTRP